MLALPLDSDVWTQNIVYPSNELLTFIAMSGSYCMTHPRTFFSFNKGIILYGLNKETHC